MTTPEEPPVDTVGVKLHEAARRYSNARQRRVDFENAHNYGTGSTFFLTIPRALLRTIELIEAERFSATLCHHEWADITASREDYDRFLPIFAEGVLGAEPDNETSAV